MKSWIFAFFVLLQAWICQGAELHFAANFPDSNQYYDGLFEILTATINEYQAAGYLADHSIVLDFSVFEWDYGYLQADVDMFSGEGTAIGLIGSGWSNYTVFSQNLTAGVPLCDGAATAPQLSIANFPLWVRVAPSDVQEAQATMAWVASRGWKSVVLMAGNDDYGQGIQAAYKAAGSDVSIVGPFTFTPASPNPDDGSVPPNSGCASVLDAVKSTGNTIIIAGMDSLNLKVCLSEAKLRGMLSSEYVWITTDAAMDYYWTFGDDAEAVDNIQGTIMAWPKELVPGPAADQWATTFANLSADDYPTLDLYRADSGAVPPWYMFFRTCMINYMVSYDKIIKAQPDPAAAAEDLALGTQGTILPGLTTKDFEHPEVQTATGPLVSPTDDKPRTYEFYYARDGKFNEFATWSGGSNIVMQADNIYRDGTTNIPTGGTATQGGGGNSKGGLPAWAIAVIVLVSLLAAGALAAMSVYIVRHQKIKKEHDAQMAAKAHMTEWSTKPHNVNPVLKADGSAALLEAGSSIGSTPTEEMQTLAPPGLPTSPSYTSFAAGSVLQSNASQATQETVKMSDLRPPSWVVEHPSDWGLEAQPDHMETLKRNPDTPDVKKIGLPAAAAMLSTLKRAEIKAKENASRSASRAGSSRADSGMLDSRSGTPQLPPIDTRSDSPRESGKETPKKSSSGRDTPKESSSTRETSSKDRESSPRDKSSRDPQSPSSPRSSTPKSDRPMSRSSSSSKLKNTASIATQLKAAENRAKQRAKDSSSSSPRPDRPPRSDSERRGDSQSSSRQESRYLDDDVPPPRSSSQNSPKP